MKTENDEVGDGLEVGRAGAAAVFELMPGWVFGKTGWRIDEARENEGAYREAFRHQTLHDAGNAWGWGDLILGYCEWLKRTKGQERNWVHYASKWEEITGHSAGTLRQFCWVARRFKSSSRLDDLTWAHHLEVAGIKDDAAAMEWLNKARGNGWTTPKLRKAIRAARDMGAEDEEPTLELIIDKELVQVRRWASAHIASVDEADIEQLIAQVREVQPLIDWWQRAMSRIQATTPGAKESLLAAA